MRNHIFKIGDIVKLNADTITKSFGELPNWFNNKSYVIITISDDPSSEYKIVSLDKEIISNSGGGNKVSTYYIKPSLKEERKRKLEKLNSL